jgi:alpha-L-fucosidase
MQVNGDGIYDSRLWKIHGGGPSTLRKIERGNLNEDKQTDLTGEDIRFMTKGNTVFAFVMGKVEIAVVNALGLGSPKNPGKIQRVQILDYDGAVQREQDNSSLRLKIPPNISSNVGFVLKFSLG